MTCCCRLHPVAAWILYFIILVICSVVFSLVPVLSLIVSIFFLIVIFIITISSSFCPVFWSDCTCCNCCWRINYISTSLQQQQQEQQQQQQQVNIVHTDIEDTMLHVEDTLLQPPSKLQPSERYVYLDNLKTALTCLVVLHHVFGAFSGGGSLGLSVGNFRNSFQPILVSLQILDQAWFMSAFFFVSAFFSPNSLAKKGTRQFLLDKFYRLGWPLLIYFFIISPLLSLMINVGFTDNGDSKH